MTSLTELTVLGILNSSESQDAKEFSKCQRSIRKMYKKNKQCFVYHLNVKQPFLNEDKYKLTIRSSFLQFPQSYSLNMEELKSRLLEYTPTSLKFEISNIVTSELLDFLPKEWFHPISYVDIRCLENDEQNSEATEAMKIRIKNFIRGFGTIENIMFKTDEITSSDFDYLHVAFFWMRRHTFQTRGFRIKYEKLSLTGADVEHILKAGPLIVSKPLYLWMDWRSSSNNLNTEIQRFLNTIEDPNEAGQYVLNNCALKPIKPFGIKNLYSKMMIFVEIFNISFLCYFSIYYLVIALININI